jgi:hypothetical protein
MWGGRTFLNWNEELFVMNTTQIGLLNVPPPCLEQSTCCTLVYSGFWIGSSIYITYFYLISDLFASIASFILLFIVIKTSLNQYMPSYLHFSILLCCVELFGFSRQFIPITEPWNYISEVSEFRCSCFFLVFLYLSAWIETESHFFRSLCFSSLPPIGSFYYILCYFFSRRSKKNRNWNVCAHSPSSCPWLLYRLSSPRGISETV